MARGFFGGFVVGAALSVGAAAILSVLAGPPVPPEIAADAPIAAVAPPGGAEPSVLRRRIEEDPQRPAAADVDAPGTEDDLALAEDATRPAGRPERGAAVPGVAQPARTGETGGIAVDGGVPIGRRPQSSAPGLPAADSGAAITAEPPRPSGLVLSGPQLVPGGEAGLQSPLAESPEGGVSTATDSAVTGIAGAAAPSAPGQPDQPAVSAETAPRPETTPPRMAGAPMTPGTPDSIGDTGPGLDGAARPAAEASAPPLVQPDDEEDTLTGETPSGWQDADGDPDAPDIELAQGTSETATRPSIGTPATSLLDRDAATGDVDASAEALQPALLRNAEPFENAENQPLMSIVLMDTGQDLEDGPIGLAALGSFPYPLSFAVDTSLPDAADRAARYREEGLEVVALVDLPQNLTASDTEVALSTLLDRLPQAVAVLEGPGSGIQGSAEMSRQVAAILRETGHGIVWRPNGLGTAQKLAARTGLASETLYRDFDSEDQSPIVIRRFLDQAAFRAGQEGSVIMVGRLRPDTITALVIWVSSERVRGVALAPVSAVLKAGQGGQ